MKTLGFLGAVAALLGISASAGVAAPTVREASKSVQAREMFREIGDRSSAIADQAFRLETMVKDMRDPQSHIDTLERLRENINNVGHTLVTLDNERAQLSDWEVRALDEVLPLVQQIAANDKLAYQAYSDGRNHLFFTPYANEMDKIAVDAQKAGEIVSGYLKLASVRQEETRLDHKLEGLTGTR